MELEEVAEKCRACQEETSEESQISVYSDENLKDIFHDVTSIKIDREDGLPGVLCVKCHTRLLDAHQFRQMCAVSALKFHVILDNLIPKKKKEEQLVNSYSELHPTEYVELPEEHTKVLSPKREQNDDDDDSNSFHGFDDDTSQENLETEESRESEGITIEPDPEEMPESHRKSQKDKQDNVDISCYICKKVFQRKSGLSRHMHMIHKKPKATVCTVCGKNCLNTRQLDVHMTEVHGVTEGLSCKTCGTTYKYREGLQAHIHKFHSGTDPVKRPRNVICEECGKAFSSITYLVQHSFIHSGVRPFACANCPKRYVTKHNLKIHMMRHAGIKNHVCTICGLRKTTSNELKVHMNYHTKERTRTCQFCQRIYTNFSSMNRHISVVHLGEKPFPCSTCGRAFGKKVYLKFHEMIHTGEKPEVCSVCGKGFIQKIALKKHMLTHQKYK
ncbi:hypothetical protein DMENIID0001_064290 [Sergentomyia squamirostris]